MHFLQFPRLTVAFVTPILLLWPVTANSQDPQGSLMLREAHQHIAAYHATHSPSRRRLRVVYFVPADREPLVGYAERLDRALQDISDFYRAGLSRFGIEVDGIPLERSDGRLVLHLVRGKSPASEYDYESGNRTVAEIRNALRSIFDVDREHVLVLYALCRKDADGRYIFDAPYYGNGSHRSGICHAADCELLDPRLLTDTERTIVYSEHYYPRVQESVAEFNTKYLGGAAHELGHGLGLPHDAGGMAEQPFGNSLMGRGNLMFRRERWGAGAPVYLARASALQLASHPLITGSDRGRWEPVEGRFATLNFSDVGCNLKITGSVVGAVPAYAVIAHAWPVSSPTDHDALTFPIVLNDGAFTIALEKLPPKTYHLRLTSLHVNGAAMSRTFKLQFDSAGRPAVAALNADWIVTHAEQTVMQNRQSGLKLLSDEAILAAPTPESRRQLMVLQSVLNLAKPVELASSTADYVFLSDAAWSAASVGWGEPARNHFWFDDQNRNGILLILSGRFYDKGLYAHSPARYTFPVNERWKTFSSTIGLKDGAHLQGSARFVVVGDGREIHRSRVLRVGEQDHLRVDITGIKELDLRTEGGEGHPHNSWAVWAEAKVIR